MAKFSRRGKTLSWVLFPFLVVLGCVHKLIRDPYRIVVVEDTVQLRHTAGLASFTVSAVLRNNSTQALIVDRCGPSAERRTENSWQTVLYPTCLPVKQTWELAAGDSAVVPVTVYEPAVPNRPDTLTTRLAPGLYRLVFQLAFRSGERSQRSVPASQSTSSPFVVVAASLESKKL